MDSKYKIGILSLGCPRNLVDSESILGRLNLKGYSIVDILKADIGIVNTCAFIDDAKAESIEAILDLIALKKEGKLKKVIVYGCLAQRYQDRLGKELSGVDAWVGRISLNHTQHVFSITPPHYAYLKICEGCINNCSYCIIPRIKGRFTSLDINSILQRVEALDENRISELNIIGQDITGYGMDLYGSTKLPQLLARIIKVTKHTKWFRLLYLYPGRITDELLELVRNEPKICKYIDLPLQHINERILKLMHRQAREKDILGLIERIRKKIPGVAIRTSLIVGFPSEGEEEFKELVDFTQDIRFERLGVFIYSREEGTAAYKIKGQIPKKIKMERLDTIMSCQQKISQENNRALLGKTLEVLIDEKEEDHYLARSQHDAPEVDGMVYVKSKRLLKPGDLVKVNITDTLEYDLAGEVS